jgi:hypothetical protein
MPILANISEVVAPAGPAPTIHIFVLNLSTVIALLSLQTYIKHLLIEGTRMMKLKCWQVEWQNGSSYQLNKHLNLFT